MYSHAKSPALFLRQQAAIHRSEFLDLAQALVTEAPPEGVRRAIQNLDLDNNEVWRIGPDEGDLALREAIAVDEGAKFDKPLSADNVIVTVGANAAVDTFLSACLAPSDTVSMFTPAFFNHLALASLNNRTLRVECLDHENDFQPDPQILKRLISENGVLLASNPCNPSSIFYTDDALAQMTEAVKEQNATLVIDESWAHFNWHSNRTNMKFDMDHTVLVSGFSKRFCLSTIRVGYAIASPGIITKMAELQDAKIIAPSGIDQRVARAALDSNETYETSLLNKLRPRRDALIDALESSTWAEKCWCDNGAFIWVRLSEGLDSWQTMKELFRQSGLLVLPHRVGKQLEDPTAPNYVFGPCDGEYLRIAFGQLDSGKLGRVENVLQAWSP